MTHSDIIPFTMEIKKYHKNGTYEVEYTPNEPDYRSIQLAIPIPLSDVESYTIEEIMVQLAKHSPQHIWSQELISKTFDDSIRKSIVGKIQEDAHNLIASELNISTIPTEEMKVIHMTLNIQRVLNSMVEDTV